MEVKLESGWKTILNDEFEQSYFKKLSLFVQEEYDKYEIFPPHNEIFNAFESCPFHNVKVVIIGQDPYHGPNQAHGLCFSVRKGLKIPPSLRNIYKEVNADIGSPISSNGDLTRWAEQGVLLINATFTVRAHEAGSHQKKGWEIFTDAVIREVSARKEHVVFILWGAYAQKKGEMIDTAKHLVLKSVHPSPLSASRGFFGNHHFSQVNQYLKSNNLTPINW